MMSQKNTQCGHVHEKLGGNKKFVCPNCNHEIARDWNGAIVGYSAFGNYFFALHLLSTGGGAS
ncbi:transposase [Scytonema sp. UIC 10036]|uniref:transposase n=1 Tax=Scytonema sp. UIC 10036 TaxID=2304196 RepID=UPI001FA986D0|nr:transposase [Scytonema sp. UIC 10036]